MRLKVRAATVCLFAFFLTTASFAQITEVNNSTSTPIPGAGHDYIKMLSETVDLANGAVSLRIQVPVPPDRGITLPFALAYDTNGVHFPVPGGSTGYTRWSSNKGFLGQGGWAYSLPRLGLQKLSQPSTLYPNETCWYSSNYWFQDEQGGRHPNNTRLRVKNNSYCDGGFTNLLTGTFEPSFSVALGPIPVLVADASGTVFRFPYPYAHQNQDSQAGNNFASLPDLIEDRNGNQLFISEQTTGVTATDSLKRTAFSYSGFGNSGDTISVSGLNGSYSLTWGTAASNFSTTWNPSPANPTGNSRCYPTTSDSETQPVVTAIALPNSQQYTFSYDPTYGTLSKITYPSGGWVSYQWGINPQSAMAIFPAYNIDQPNIKVNCYEIYDKPAVLHRYVSFDGTTIALQQDFTYSTSWGSGNSWISKQTTVVTRDLKNGTSSQAVYTYVPGTSAGSTDVQIPVEQSIAYKNDAGATLKTVNKSWQSRYLLSSEQTVLDTGSSAKTTYTYTAQGMLQEKDEYDFDQSTPSRKTVINYQSFANTPIFPTGPSIFDRPSSVITYDGSNNPVAETDYAYDEINVSSASATGHDDTNYPATYKYRGNATTKTQKCSPNCADAITNYAYDQTGQVVSAKDPGGHTTSYSYADSFSSGVPPGSTNAYLTKITHPVTNGVNHIENFSYSYADGQLTLSKDQNQQPTNYKYNDSLGRLTETDYPDGGQTNITYNDTGRSVTTSRKLDTSGRFVNSVAIMDGVGHAVQAQLTSDPQGTVYSDTTYDGLGRTWKVSNPYRSTAESTYGTTTTQYDALGRVTQVTNPDNSTRLITYTGRATKTQDEGNGTARVTRVSQTDGLGNLKSLCELSAVAQLGTSGTAADCGLDIAATGFLTIYDYDTLGNLKAVNQGSLNSRIFTYNSLSQLLTAYNPESGTITYGYAADPTCNPNGEALRTKTDARGVTTTYCYDALHRVTQTSYNDSVTPTAYRYYDESSIYGATLQNTVGRLSRNVVTDSSTAYNLYTYDEMGRVKGNWQDTPFFSGSSKYLAYSYDLAGDISTSSNGAGVTFTNNYNAAARLTSLTSSLADAAHPGTLLSNVVYGNSSYGPFGITSAAFGNGVTEQRAYSNRGWQQSLTAQGFVATPAVAGSVNMTLSGSERVGGAGTGSVTFSGTEQSTQVLNQAAAAGTGSFRVTGSEQSKQVLTTAATSGTGSVTISGSERTTVVYHQCGQNSTCPTTVYDGGTVSITVNGLAKSTTYGSTSTAASIASALAGAFNTDSTSTVTVRASGGTVTFTANPTGAGTNYTLSATSATSNTANFTGTSFPAAASGATLTGGANAVYSTVYDSGTVTSTVNGFSVSASYGSGSTASSLATALASSFSVTSSPVTANASGGTVTVTAKVPGLVTNYSMSASATYNSSQFASPSFADSASGGALTGGRDATYNTVYDAGTATITVNGYSKSTSYGQATTPSSIASALATAFANDANSPVNATANGSIVNITSRLAGAGTNYSLTKSVSTSQTQYFSQPSFSASASGSTLTGGIDTGGTVTYDTGNFSITVNGYTKTTTYGQSSTPTTLASALATAFTNDAASPVSAVVSAATITFTARATGYASNYSFSTTTATTQTGFTPGSSSFSGPASGTLAGGIDSSTAPATLYSYSLGFDPNGDIASANDSVNGNWSYGYDDFNRLSSAAKSGQSFTYDYDRYGNRWHQNGTSQFMATFSSNNNRMDGYTYDLAGNVLTDNQNNQYTYDAESRVITGPGVSYKYDADGNRIQKVLSNGNKFDYLYDLSGRIVTEFYNGGWSRGEIFAGSRHIATYSGATTNFSNTDWLGTERVRTGVSGTASETCSSLPFGDGQSCTGTEWSPVHFTGKERDSESGLDYFGARYYVSSMGRFSSPDEPFYDGDLSDPQKLNLYSYVRNSPTTSIDPDGHLVVVCIRGQQCQQWSDQEYYDAVNGNNPGISAPKWGQSGNILCGGEVCGTATYYDQGAVTPLGEQYLAGYAVGAGIGRALGGIWSGISGWFGRGAGETAGEVGGTAGATASKATFQDLLQGAVDDGTGQSTKSGGFAQATKDFEALGGQSKTLGRVQVKDLPDGGKAVLRDFSKEGRPTLEYQPASGGSKTEWIRYNP